VKLGTPVEAAASGKVVYAGRLASYGALVVIEHERGAHTVYANLSEFTVRKGARVKEGQAIGRSGPEARALAPHVHFEVRQKGQPIDPSLLLPPR
jgi:murein DD-endopeptidase MepM/ murein hydrolase activator NlpD